MTRAASLRSPTPGALDPRAIRRDFPVFERNPGLVFLDSGASAQKPAAVIDGVAEYLPQRLRQCASRRLPPLGALDRAL